MRTLKLILLCLVPTVLLAQEPAADPTAQVPADAAGVIRLPSAERLDAIGKELLPLVKELLPPEIVQMIEAGASNPVLGSLGLAGKELDRTKPVFVAMSDHDVAIASGKSGLITTGDADAPKRGKATAMLAGDLSIHVYAGEQITQNKDMIEAGFQMVPQFVAMAGPFVPDWARKCVPPVMDLARGAVFGIESVDYAMTLKGSVIESEGRITTKEGSGFRKLLGGIGPAAENRLAGYMPADAMMVYDGVSAPGWPDTQAFLDGKLGEGANLAFSYLFGPAITTWGVTSGRYAGATSMAGMMASKSLVIYELKEGVDPKTVLDKFDTVKVNDALKKHGIAMSYKVLKDVAKHGETSLHQIVVEAEDPMLGMMFGMIEVYMAVEGKHLVMVSAPGAADEIKAFLDRVRGDPDPNHPHLQAMARLGNKRNAGVTFNFAQFKALAPMLNMVNPQAGAMFGAMPDDLVMSTAITVADGNISWRGDWPLKGMAAVATAMLKMQDGEAKPPPDEEFD